MALVSSSIASAQVPSQIASYSRGGDVLPRGAELEFLTRSSINSRTAQVADRVDLVVSKNVLLNGAIVIPRGTQATGEVWLAKPKGSWGSRGKLEIRLISLTIEGLQIPITGAQSARGGTNLAGSVISAFFTLSLPLGFGITGSSAILPINTALKGETGFDMLVGAREFSDTEISGLAQQRPTVQQAAYRGPHDLVLDRGTAVHFRLMSGLSSKVNDVGDLFELEVVDDVVLNGEVVIPRGSPAVGQVDRVKSKSSFGQRGKLSAHVVSMRINGLVVPISGPLHAAGDKNIGGAVGVTLPVGYFVTGTSAYLPAGTLMLAVTGESIPFGPFLRPNSYGQVSRSSGQDGHVLASNTKPVTRFVPTPAEIFLKTTSE
ncbi:hypothetical protein KX816_05710 [Sphingosinicellaceae bacterium]|nr:hypothetical protein KX816_05710 [Sphingosinicellaceae bacterium]